MRVLGLLGLIRACRTFVFLLFTVALASLGWYLVKKSKEPVKETDNNVQKQQFRGRIKSRKRRDDVVAEDLLAMEVGYRLIPLVDNDQQGELLRRIRGLRKNLPGVGYLPPVVHICDNLELAPTAYRILIKGAEVPGAASSANRWLAVAGNATELSGGMPHRNRHLVYRRCGLMMICVSEHRFRVYTVVSSQYGGGDTTLIGSCWNAPAICSVVRKHRCCMTA